MTIAIDYRTQYEAAEERIRELEDKLTQVRETLELTRTDRESMLKRIAKAKAILTAPIPQSQLALEIIRALEALEGK